MSHANEFLCKECNKSYSKHSNLRSHVRKFHPGKLEVLAPNKLKRYNFQCEICEKNFSHKHHLKFHQKTHDNIITPERVQMCPICKYQDTKSELLNHFHSVHNIVMKTEQKDFPTDIEFQSWKTEIEKSTNSSFVKIQGSYATKSGLKMEYICHRSGYYNPQGKGLRRLKIQGSNKINGFCPAAIVVTLLDVQKYQVHFLQTHVGHDNDLGHISLTQSEWSMLASKITTKIPFPSILDDIRDSVTKNCKLERLHLLTKKDLYNIEQCYQLKNTSVKRQKDAGNNLSIDEVKKEQIEIIEAISKQQFCSIDIEKEMLRKSILSSIDKITTIEELESVKKLIAPIDPTLAALKINHTAFTATQTNTAHNKNVTP